MRLAKPAFQALTVIAALVAAASAGGAELKLDGNNTKIGFVGSKPDGKHDGGFKTVTGAVSYDAADLTSTELSVNIETASLWADDDKLAAHLKSPDFFDVRKYEAATFKSTQVAKGDAAGEYNITGELTLRGVTKSITFPATIAVKDGALTLSSSFTIKRTDFGMTFGAGKIDDDVAITAHVGAANERPPMVYEIIVITLLLPACLSAAVVFVELLTSGNRPPFERADHPAWLTGGVAAAGSFLLSYGLYSWTRLDPTDHWHWLPQAVVAVTLTSLVAAMASRAVARAIVVFVVFTFAWLMTPAWEELAGNRHWIAIGLGSSIFIYLAPAWWLAGQRRAGPPWLIGLVLTLHLVAAAVVIERSGWASLAELAIVPAVVVAVLSLASWLYPRRQFLCGAVPIFAVVFPATLMFAWYGTFTSISLWAFLLPALGPIAMLVLLATIQRLSRAAQVAALLSVLIFPLMGIAIAFATAH